MVPFVSTKALPLLFIMQKRFNNGDDFDFNLFFKSLTDIHKYHTINKQNLYLQRDSRNWGKQSFTCHNTVDWNTLPKNFERPNRFYYLNLSLVNC